MSKRGTIMRDPSAGPGLVVVQGRQYPFTLESTWRSEVLPHPGVVVDVDFDDSGRISAMAPVPESRLAREQADAALQFAREKGTALASQLVARFGMPRLVAAAVLLAGWFLLSTISIDAAFLGKLKVTFWQVLALLNAGNPLEAMAGARGRSGTGLYGLVAMVCLAGPFLASFWKDSRAHLGGLLPLLFMLVVALVVGNKLAGAFGANQELGEMYAGMQRHARAEAMKAVSVGAGAYLSALAGLYLAAAAVKDYLVRRATDRTLSQE